MSSLDRFFDVFRKNTGSVSKVNITESPAEDDALRFKECMTFINGLMSRNDYIARSEYISDLEQYNSAPVNQ